MSRPAPVWPRDDHDDGSPFAGIFYGLVLAAVMWGVIIGTSALIVWLADTTVAHATPLALTGVVLLGVAGFGLAWVRDRVLDARDRRRRRRAVLAQIQAINVAPSWQRLRGVPR